MDMSIVDKLKLVLSVIKNWEVIVTLIGFIIVWSLLTYIANPWRQKKAKKTAKIKISKPAKAVKTENAETDNSSTDDGVDESQDETI